jgi:hypothetical protein
LLFAGSILPQFFEIDAPAPGLPFLSRGMQVLQNCIWFDKQDFLR